MATYNALGSMWSGPDNAAIRNQSDQEIWQSIQQYRQQDGADTTRMSNWLQRMKYTPDQIRTALQSNGVDIADATNFVMADPNLKAWATGGSAQPATQQGGALAGLQQTGMAGQPTQPMQPPTMPGAGGPPPSRPNPMQTSQRPPTMPPAPTQQQPPTMPGGPLSWGSGSMPWANANPATNWMAGTITQQVNSNLQNNVLPGIRQNAMQANGIGGSRQGVAEGRAIGDAMTGLAGNLAGLYSGQFNQDRNYGLQSDALDLNVYNANQNWMRQGQQDQLALLNSMMGWQQQGINNATQVQNTPLGYWQGFSGGATQLGGMGGTQSQNMQGNPLLGGIGGAIAGYNLYNQWNKGA